MGLPAPGSRPRSEVAEATAGRTVRPWGVSQGSVRPNTPGTRVRSPPGGLSRSLLTARCAHAEPLAITHRLLVARAAAGCLLLCDLWRRRIAVCRVHRKSSGASIPPSHRCPDGVSVVSNAVGAVPSSHNQIPTIPKIRRLGDGGIAANPPAPTTIQRARRQPNQLNRGSPTDGRGLDSDSDQPA